MLVGRVCTQPETRHSPAGIPLTRFSLEHVSRRPQAGRAREVRCRVRVLAAGEELRGALQGLQPDTPVRIEGFLAGAGYRASEHSLILNAERIERLA
ncbi:MAG: primosomal replication protein N [Gammaproteobacteria bacterium]|nr:primosomal replication protein N [Gammaproteobacteria bacterium]NIR99187.1 primosomal replication protein N [Gammaproteobacteria bacterium]NIT64811.1 primosomal replication protein N [Gammaproteobacteria bacterium]NIV21773.1 primosomal replication protein N [Gammaproteobacteria bacterium]NIX10786.1 primosomal replication protein N [Gammaproteobacteria bacterium]